MRNTTLVTGVTHDGYDIYKYVPSWLQFLNYNGSVPLVSADVQSWMEKFGREQVGPLNVGYAPEIAEQVLIDVPRRLVLHTGDDEAFGYIGEGFGDEFREACRMLEGRHFYEVHAYTCSGVRETLRELRGAGD